MKVIYHVAVREEVKDPEDQRYIKEDPKAVEQAVQVLFSKSLNIDPKTVSVGLEIVKEDQ